MRYKIVSERDVEQLEQTVEELLGTGWQLQGGPFHYDNEYHQALTHPLNVLTETEETAKRLAQANPIFNISEQDLTEQQRIERGEITDYLINDALDSANRNRPENESE